MIAPEPSPEEEVEDDARGRRGGEGRGRGVARKGQGKAEKSRIDRPRSLVAGSISGVEIIPRRGRSDNSVAVIKSGN